MRYPVVTLLAFSILLAGGVCFAQSNELLDTLLEEETSSLGQAAYLVLAASGRVSEGATPAEAETALREQGWSIPEKSAGDPITLGEYSYLLMQAFDLKGGVMYRIFPGPRYAARELVFLELVKGDRSPYRTFSGEEAVGILSRLLEWKGGQP